jgi:hypothetical protein
MPPNTIAKDASIAYVIGAQKAGTTWLYHQFKSHPDMLFQSFKEVHYFDFITGKDGQGVHRKRLKNLLESINTLKIKDVAENTPNFRKFQRISRLYEIFNPNQNRSYQKYFDYMVENRKTETYACDFTPEYALLNQETYKKMVSLRKSKFIFVMREPVARRWSQIRMTVGNQNGVAPGNFDQACNDFAKNLLAKGVIGTLKDDYHSTLENTAAAIPEKDLYITFFESLFSQESLDNISDFLKISKREVQADLSPRNEGMKAEMEPDVLRATIEAMRPQYNSVCHRFGDRVPAAWHSRFAT